MPHFVYGYGEAVADGACRPLAFRLLDATLRWRVDDRETIAAFADELEPQDDARRLRTAIDPGTPLLPRLLRDADALLLKVRAVVPDAAGLVLCDDRAHARATATLLRTIAGEKPVVVVSDESGAHAAIDRFARGGPEAARWLVAVNMVSEGVDVPRLVVAGYATVKRTDLFFRQGVGRVVRRRAGDPGDLVATVFLPADRTLVGCAERVELELRRPVADEPIAAFEVEPPPGLARRPDFQALDALVEPGGMIVAGVRYGRAEVDAARRLLRELGQPERALRSVLEFVRRERIGAGGGTRLPLPLPPPPVRRCPPTAASRPSGRRSTGSPAAGRSSAARSTPATRGPRPRRGSIGPWASTAVPRRERRSWTTAWPSCAQSSRSWSRATRRMPSACASPTASRR